MYSNNIQQQTSNATESCEKSIRYNNQNKLFIIKKGNKSAINSLP